jgi:endo-1,4-beta-xylanase
MNMKSAVRFSFFWCLILVAWAQPASAANVLKNPGYEWGNTSGWTRWGGSLTVIRGSALNGEVHSGSYCALMSNRTQTWQGPVQSVLGALKADTAYHVSAWVKLQNAASDQAAITVAQTDGAGTNYHGIARATTYPDQWVCLSGFFTLDVAGELTRLDMYIEGPQPGVDFCVDDVCIEETGDWRDLVRTRTEQNRKRDASIFVLSPEGQPVAGAEVNIRQIRHHFAFGSAINRNVLTTGRFNRYGDFFREHFEWAVLENESKWYHTERVQGNVTYQDADRIYDWCQSNGITMRGHCLYWATDGMVQDWLKALNTNQLRAAVESRMESAVNHFKGKFVHWDINNEMVPGHFYKDRLGEAIRIWMFQQAREIDPDCRLFVNEYNVISGGYDLSKCMQLVRWLQDNGAPVDCIGAQCHFSSGFDRWSVIDRLDTLATLGLPIWCTEFDMADPDEYVRAQELEDFYRIAFSHPAVEGILMWGFWENSHWRENCHIVNADWSLNEAGRRYEALLKEWTTEAEGTTDASGIMTFRGFHGVYDITIAPPGGAALTTTITLPPGPDPAEFAIALQ